MSRRALITGASRGIGKAIATKLAECGFDLILTCVYNVDVLQDMAIDLESQHNISCKAYKCDCSKPNELEELFKSIGNIDVLINNAGISYMGLLQDMSVEDWDNVINTNLRSAFITSKLAIPGMLEKKDGCIINISSMWGQAGASCEVAYSASKGGLDAFTKALAKELAPSNIAVNAISCGVIDTDMNKCFDEAERCELMESIPAGRFAMPAEVAEVVWQLINCPGYLTGQIIRIDGGMI